MHVIATAGHVDHGKSALVRALTGMEPDRLADERRRGLTIELGYAWTTLPTGHEIAFVDVPGHQRFIATMLAGIGPAPAVLFVVAADEGWARQSEEHLAAMDALRVHHGVLVITRSDCADAEPALSEARARLSRSSLGTTDSVVVSSRTGAGLDDLRVALGRLCDNLPAPDLGAPVRLWVDRAFTIRGAGTVVTGTLSSGSVAIGDQLTLRDKLVTVRGIQRAGSAVESVDAVSRVALNLRAVPADEVGRGDVLLTPQRFRATEHLDVRLDTPVDVPTELVVHLGTAAVPARLRPLGPDTARLTLQRALPVRAGDRAVLRDPGRQTVASGALVLDADPPKLRRRGAAALRGRELESAAIPPAAEVEIARRGVVARRHLEMLGVDLTGRRDVQGWFVSPERWAQWSARIPGLVDEWSAQRPWEAAMPRGVLQRALGVPHDALLDALISSVGLSMAADGVDVPPRTAPLGPAERGLATLLDRLAREPFQAPEHDELHELGLGRRELAAAERTGRVIQLAGGVVLGRDAAQRADIILAVLAQPFTASEARRALGTTRRVAIPLLEHLDACGVTERVDTATRRMVTHGG